MIAASNVVVTVNDAFGKLRNNIASPFFWLSRHIHTVIDERQRQKANNSDDNNSKKKRDYLQILMDTQTEDASLNKAESTEFATTHYEKKMTNEVNQ